MLKYDIGSCTLATFMHLLNATIGLYGKIKGVVKQAEEKLIFINPYMCTYSRFVTAAVATMVLSNIFLIIVVVAVVIIAVVIAVATVVAIATITKE